MRGRVLCLPTYDERENLARMVDALETVRRGRATDLDVLVIDDSSPDGTGEIADRARRHARRGCTCCTARQGGARPRLPGRLPLGARARLRPRCSRWTATSRTTRAACRRLRDAVRGGADLALGSRYVRGRRRRDWGLVRRIISRGGCLYARLLLGLPVHDLTGGFKCFHRAVLEAIELDERARRGLRVPDRDDLPREAARLPRRRGPDRLQRPRRAAARRCRGGSCSRPRGGCRSCATACCAAAFHARDKDNRPRRGIL